MYCRNCGYMMDDLAAVCVKCGVPAGKGNKYCSHCGSGTDPEAAICVTCGYSQKGAKTAAAGSEAKSKLVAGLLGIFLGGIGAHNWYLGYTKKAIIDIALTFCCGAGAIWGMIEGIMILSGKVTEDADGNPLKE